MPGIDLNVAIQIVVILFASVTLHELAHAFVADRLGDPTPRRNGQLTLNPAAHMDQFAMLFTVIAALAGFFFAFGRTYINPQNLKWGPQKGGAVVAMVGPLTNLCIAVIVGILLKVLLVTSTTHCGLLLPPNVVALSQRGSDVAQFLSLAVEANIFLCLFNLIPIPPLDGFSIVSAFLTPRQLYSLAPLIQYAPMFMLILIFFAFYTNFFSDDVFSPVMNHFENFMGIPEYYQC